MRRNSLAFRLIVSSAIVAVVALLAFLPRVPVARGIVLTAGGPQVVSLSPESARSWVGTSGRAITPLRPAGTAMLDGERVDIVTEGEFVMAGAALQVLRQEGHRVVVRTAAVPHPDGDPKRGES